MYMAPEWMGIFVIAAIVALVSHYRLSGQRVPVLTIFAVVFVAFLLLYGIPLYRALRSP